jgi:hypothetical protein
VSREVEKHGRTKAAAERLLATAVRDRAYSGGGAELSPDSRVSALAEAWYAEAEHRGLSPATMAAYRPDHARLPRRRRHADGPNPAAPPATPPTSSANSKPTFSRDRYKLRKLRDTGAAQLLGLGGQ